MCSRVATNAHTKMGGMGGSMVTVAEDKDEEEVSFRQNSLMRPRKSSAQELMADCAVARATAAGRLPGFSSCSGHPIRLSAVRERNLSLAGMQIVSVEWQKLTPFTNAQNTSAAAVQLADVEAQLMDEERDRLAEVTRFFQRTCGAGFTTWAQENRTLAFFSVTTFLYSVFGLILAAIIGLTFDGTQEGDRFDSFLFISPGLLVAVPVIVSLDALTQLNLTTKYRSRVAEFVVFILFLLSLGFGFHASFDPEDRFAFRRRVLDGMVLDEYMLEGLYPGDLTMAGEVRTQSYFLTVT